MIPTWTIHEPFINISILTLFFRNPTRRIHPRRGCAVVGYAMEIQAALGDPSVVSLRWVRAMSWDWLGVVDDGLMVVNGG